MFGFGKKDARGKVVIRYKSGLVVKCKATKFKITIAGSQLTKLEYEGLSPIPLLFGLDNIESIWEEK